MSTHETYSSHNHSAEGSSDRSFGIVFAVVFGIVGCWPLRHGLPVRMWALVVGGLFLVVALAAPAVLAPLNRIWTKFGLLISRVTNPIVTALLFFVVFTPFAMVLRMLGKDLLRQKLDPTAKSYWIERTPAGPEPESMVHQF